MTDPALFLLILDFLLIALLPRIFFRSDGSLNLKWFLTACPLAVAPIYAIVAAAMDWEPLIPDSWWAGAKLVSVTLGTVSLGLMCLTLGTHRIPLALWHQDNDAPQSIVTYGAYSRIRHPFYTSFLIALLAALAYFPHVLTVLTLGYGYAALNMTAAREERNLTGSEFGDEYAAYVRHTGRFLPRPGQARTAAPAHQATEV